MILNINKRYLLFPVSSAAEKKFFLFRKNEKLIFDLAIHYDALFPDAIFCYDVERFIGTTLEVNSTPEIDFDIRQCDTENTDNYFTEKYRPIVRFSAPSGWINDPNGLVYADGIYHMFYQHNPVSTGWGNMHWGHAVSRDLVHWEHRPIAIFPDELGTAFSGSGIVDYQNLLGLQMDDTKTLAFFYTAAGNNTKTAFGKPFVQCLVYSTDGGKTFKKYEGNPIIGEIRQKNRDPKVVYDEQLDCYHMALYLNGDEYAMYTSKDLLNWKWQQELSLADDAECPDLYPITLDETGEKFWILSGANDRYLVGKFRQGGCFQPIQASKRLHYGKNSYASQTFTGNDDGRVIRISWNNFSVPSNRFNCSMCIPASLRLKAIDDEYRLCILPVDEIKKLYKDTREYTDVMISQSDCFKCNLFGKAQDIILSAIVQENTVFSLDLLGIHISVEPGANILKCRDYTMPLFAVGNQVKIRIITDTNAIEIFVNDGEAFQCIGHISDYNLNKFFITCNNSSMKLNHLQISELENIWVAEAK